MTYRDFLRLAMDATEFETVEDYIAETGGSVPESVRDDALIPMLGDLYAYGRDRSIAVVRQIAGMNRTAFAREYRLPLRSVENWEATGASGRSAPPYLIDLIAFAVITDKYL